MSTAELGHTIRAFDLLMTQYMFPMKSIELREKKRLRKLPLSFERDTSRRHVKHAEVVDEKRAIWLSPAQMLLPSLCCEDCVCITRFKFLFNVVKE
jgi:hypothetical protein